MSYTFPSKPTRTQQPGNRQRQTAGQNRTGVSHQNNAGNQNDRARMQHVDQQSDSLMGAGARPKNNNATPGQQQDTREPQTYNAFTMIPPNEKKRQQVAKQAERGMQSYEAHKKKHQLGQVSYVGTAGGGVYEGTGTEHEARQRAAREQKTAQFNSRQKSQQYRVNKKQQEDKEIQKKKDTQRAKTVHNAVKNEERQQRLKDDHSRKNQAFLDRLERQGRH